MLKVLSRLALLAILVSASVGLPRHAQAQTGCSVNEPQLTVSAYRQLMVAAMNGDVQQIARLSQQLDRALIKAELKKKIETKKQGKTQDLEDKLKKRLKKKFKF